MFGLGREGTGLESGEQEEGQREQRVDVHRRRLPKRSFFWEVAGGKNESGKKLTERSVEA